MLLRFTQHGYASSYRDGLVFEHGTGHAEKPICHRAERSGVTVTAGSQCCVLGFADGVVLNGDAGPVIDRVLQPIVSCQAADDDQ